MHRYHPRFHIVQADDLYSVRWSVFQTFTFPETSFTAVTSYQNTKVLHRSSLPPSVRPSVRLPRASPGPFSLHD